MSNELVHKSVGTSMTQAEYEATDSHVCNSQATGDLIYASSASQLTRLAIGTTGQQLQTIGGVPVWAANAWPKQATGVTVGSMLSYNIVQRADLAANTLRASPIWLPWPCTLDRIGVGTYAAGTGGGTARVGLYTDSGNNVPSTLIVDAGTVAIDAIGRQLATISQAISPGAKVWLVCNFSVADADFDCIAHNEEMSLQSNPQDISEGWTVATAYGALPASWPGGSAKAYAVPYPYYRIASYP